MDILISSNLERLIYYIAGNDATKNASLMAELKSEGKYTITDEMKANLTDFVGGYASEARCAKMIKDLYDKCGYVIDTHTAVAGAVYEDYKQASGDDTITVIASTASPYKFMGSVMSAIDDKYASMDDFALIDELEKVASVAVPKAVDDIRNAPVLHNNVCEKNEMEQAVTSFLGI